MITLDIPGHEVKKIENLVLDFNGTIAFSGNLIDGVEERLHTLSSMLKIYIITADTNGTVEDQCQHLPVSIHIIKSFSQHEQKASFVKELEGQSLCIGNGVNDERMFEEASIALAIIGQEGCSTKALLKSDLLISSINDGLDLLLYPNRLIATLRK